MASIGHNSEQSCICCSRRYIGYHWFGSIEKSRSRQSEYILYFISFTYVFFCIALFLCLRFHFSSSSFVICVRMHDNSFFHHIFTFQEESRWINSKKFPGLKSDFIFSLIRFVAVHLFISKLAIIIIIIIKYPKINHRRKFQLLGKSANQIW